MWRWRYQTMALSNSLCGISLVLSNVNAESMFLNGCGLRTHQHSEMPWTPAYRNAVTHQHTDMPWNHITPKCRATMRSVILTVTMNSRNTTGSSAVVWLQFCLLLAGGWGGGGGGWDAVVYENFKYRDLQSYFQVIRCPNVCILNDFARQWALLSNWSQVNICVLLPFPYLPKEVENLQSEKYFWQISQYGWSNPRRLTYHGDNILGLMGYSVLLVNKSDVERRETLGRLDWLIRTGSITTKTYSTKTDLVNEIYAYLPWSPDVFNMIPSSLKPYRSCCANKYCLPIGPLFYQARQQSPLAQHWAHRTHSVPTKIAPVQYFSSTSQETGHINIPQPFVMQSSYSSLRSLSEPAAISIGTALSPYDSCCANKDYSSCLPWSTPLSP